MKLNLRTLNGQILNLEIEESATVQDLKNKLVNEKEYLADGLKLLFSGKVLVDADTLNASGIKESSTLILMGKKVGSKLAQASATVKEQKEEKKQESTAAPQSTSAPATTSAPTSTASSTTTATTQPTPAPATTAPTTTTATTTSATTSAPASDIVVGSQFEQTVQQFLEMGFERAEIDKCMRAAFNNPERAIEYLTGGIPPNILRSLESAPAPRSTAPQQTQPSSQQQQDDINLQDYLEGDEEGEEEGEEGLEGLEGADLSTLLQRMPQFNQMRAAIQQNPELLQPLMQQISQSNPELFSLIFQNQQEFLRLLNTPVDQTQQQQQQQQQQERTPPQQIGGQNIPPELAQLLARRPNTIMISKEEDEAIQRLTALGFDRATAAQAYFACGKDENAAANFLFEGGFDDEMGDFEDEQNDNQQ